MKRMWSRNELVKQVKEVKKDIATLVDAQGRERFIEGDGEEVAVQEGVAYSYLKWSLSGSHLLIVCAGTIASATETSTQVVVEYPIPKWIYDKLYPMVDNYLDFKNVPTTNHGYNQVETFQAVLSKKNNANTLCITTLGKTFASYDVAFRISFDMLIDNE